MIADFFSLYDNHNDYHKAARTRRSVEASVSNSKDF